MAFRAPHDGVDTGDELILVEGLGEVIVGSEAQSLHLVLDAGHSGQDQDRRLDLGDPERAKDLVARHVRKVQVEKDDVVVVELAEVDALFAEIRRIDVEVLGFQHQLDALRSCAVVFDKKYAHVNSPALAHGLRSSLQLPIRDRRVSQMPSELIRNANTEWLTNPDSHMQAINDLVLSIRCWQCSCE